MTHKSFASIAALLVIPAALAVAIMLKPVAIRCRELQIRASGHAGCSAIMTIPANPVTGTGGVATADGRAYF